VTKTLVVDNSKVNIDFHLAAVCATVHNFVSIIVIPMLSKLLAKIFHDIIIFVVLKWLSFKDISIQSSTLSCHTLNKHTYVWKKVVILSILKLVWCNALPIVILEGKAWGLMIISGVMPVSVNGISIEGHRTERTPFYPCLDENLSPIIGLRGILILYSILGSLVFSSCTRAIPSSLPSSESLW